MSFNTEFKTLSKLLLESAVSLESAREKVYGADAWKHADARRWRQHAEQCRKQAARLQRMAAASSLRA